MGHAIQNPLLSFPQPFAISWLALPRVRVRRHTHKHIFREERESVGGENTEVTRSAKELAVEESWLGAAKLFDSSDFGDRVGKGEGSLQYEFDVDTGQVPDFQHQE